MQELFNIWIFNGRFYQLCMLCFPRETVNFVSRENIEIQGKQNWLFPEGQVFKWFVIETLIQ